MIACFFSLAIGSSVTSASLSVDGFSNCFYLRVNQSISLLEDEKTELRKFLSYASAGVFLVQCPRGPFVGLRCHAATVLVELIRQAEGKLARKGFGAPIPPIVLYWDLSADLKKKDPENALAEAAVRLAGRLGASCCLDLAGDHTRYRSAMEIALRLAAQYKHAVEKYTPLSAAAFYEQVSPRECRKKSFLNHSPSFLPFCFRKSPFVNPPTLGGSSLLHELMEHAEGTLALVKKILDASPPHVVNWRDGKGRAPLHLVRKENRVLHSVTM